MVRIYTSMCFVDAVMSICCSDYGLVLRRFTHIFPRRAISMEEEGGCEGA